ncbi:MAG: hypothetical protein QF824_02060 [Candidatus Woesearchaeota archaeon]|jgi:mRNA-degrading endonuclease RelE of RelBE toxin-antitoxin system|nr:hypothetical protein [Candidatus Woesearchaeota archaeon]
MDNYTTRPIEEINKVDFKGILTNKENSISTHALDHLSEKQRKVFKEEELVNMIEKESPRKIYLQFNGRYAAYYRKPEGYLKLILEVDDKKITIVTFINILEIPKLDIKNE